MERWSGTHGLHYPVRSSNQLVVAGWYLEGEKLLRNLSCTITAKELYSPVSTCNCRELSRNLLAGHPLGKKLSEIFGLYKIHWRTRLTTICRDIKKLFSLVRSGLRLSLSSFAQNWCTSSSVKFQLLRKCKLMPLPWPGMIMRSMWDSNHLSNHVDVRDSCFKCWTWMQKWNWREVDWHIGIGELNDNGDEPAPVRTSLLGRMDIN